MKIGKKHTEQDVYYPKIIPDTLTPELERLSRDLKDREYRDKREYISTLIENKRQRIQNTKVDRRTHAIGTIIEWTEAGKRTIPYSYFNYYIEEQQGFALFLNQLKKAGCIEEWNTNPYKDSHHSEYIFSGVNVIILQQYTLHPGMSNTTMINWQNDFLWQNSTFIFGSYGQIEFKSRSRKELFNKLAEAEGNWVKIAELKGNKDDSYVRSTLSQIEQRFDEKLKKHFSIPSTKDDNAEGKPDGQGGYRIKFSSQP